LNTLKNLENSNRSGGTVQKPHCKPSVLARHVEKQCGFAAFASMVHRAARILQVLSSRQQQILILAQTVANNASGQLLAADAEK